MLKSIVRKKNKQLFCVDEYLGEAHNVCFRYLIFKKNYYQGFDNLISSITKLTEMGQMNSGEGIVFKQGLRVIRSFLESQFTAF